MHWMWLHYENSLLHQMIVQFNIIRPIVKSQQTAKDKDGSAQSFHKKSSV